MEPALIFEKRKKEKKRGEKILFTELVLRALFDFA